MQTTVVTQTKKRRMRRRGIRRYSGLITVLLLGLLIVNIPSIVDYVTVEKDYEETADIMANFIVAEYERQIATNDDVNHKEIVKLAKKLDRNHGFTVSYSGNSFFIFQEYDGDSPVIYNTIRFDN